MRILVVGYYGHGNVGDDLFEAILPKLLESHHVETCDLDRIRHWHHRLLVKDFDLIVLGGGDLINEYFYSKYRYLAEFDIPIHAWGVGLVEHCPVRYLQPLDVVWCRNTSDLLTVTRALGGDWTHYIPDILFAGPLVRPLPKARPQTRIAVVLDQSLEPYLGILEPFLTSLAGRWQIDLVVFDPRDHHLQHRLLNIPNSILYHPTSGWDALDYLAQSQFIFGSKLHSLLIATILGRPFLALGITRKCRLFLTEHNLDNWLVDYNLTHLYEKWLELLEQQEIVQRKLQQLSRRLTNYWKAVFPQLLSAERRRERQNVDPIDKCLAQFPKPRPSDALLITTALTGHSSNPYTWGMTENLAKGVPLAEQIKFILDHQARQPRHLGLNLTFMSQDDFAGLHRSGWQHVVDYLQVLGDRHGVWCDTYLERTFFWQKSLHRAARRLPYTRPWLGFTHHTSLMAYTAYNTVALSHDPDFVVSLATCQGLITLSDIMAKWWRERLTKLGYNIPVVSLVHPTQCRVPEFRLNTAKPHLVQVGAWYRHMFAIYETTVPKGWQKYILQGRAMENYFPPEHVIVYYQELFGRLRAVPRIQTLPGAGQICRDFTQNKWLQGLVTHLNHTFTLNRLFRRTDQVLVDLEERYPFDHQRRKIRRHIRKLLNSVEVISHLSDAAYDQLLTHSVVLLFLADASAVNTLIECVVRRTPILVNPLPAIVEVLGEDYPLYIHSLADVPRLLKKRQLRRGVEYLHRINIDQFRIDAFLESFRDTVIWQQLNPTA